MDTSKGPQKVARRGPQSFDRVDMHLTDSIAIIISGPFLLTMTDRVVGAMDLVVALPFIRITSRRRFRITMHMLLQSLAIGMLSDSQAALPAGSANRADHWWTIIFVGSVTALLVRSAAWRIQRI